MFDLDAELDELASIAAEAIGWLPLASQAYLHIGKPDEEQVIITVVGAPDVTQGEMNVLLLG